MESSSRGSIMLLPKRAPTNRTNIESSQRQYEAEQRRIQGMQQRRQEREFESRVVRSGPREERNALVQTRLSAEPPATLHPRDDRLASNQWRTTMTTRQAAPVSRGAAPATVAECRREQLQAVARENLAAAAAKQQAVRAERTQQQPMTFFDRFSN